MPLIAVKDVKRSVKFYQELFQQTVVEDYGENVTFSGGFCIQEKFGWITGLPEESVVEKSHNMELYFETEDIDDFVKKLEGRPDLEYVHKLKTYSWQQRVVRIYDPDHHIIEIGEPLEAVVKRLLRDGLSLPEVAKITQQSLEMVTQCRQSL